MKRLLTLWLLLVALAAGQTKVSELPALTGAGAVSTDVLPIVDVSAGAAGSKKITLAELFATTAATTTATTAAQLPANVQTALAADPEGALEAMGIGSNDSQILVGNNYATAEERGDALGDAYAAAKLLTPNGASLSATNRALVIIPPGDYLMTSTLVLDAEFVDLAAQMPESGGRPLETDDHQPNTIVKPLSEFRPPRTYLYLAAVDNTVEQSARDVRLKGFGIANLLAEDTYVGGFHGFAVTSTTDEANDRSIYEQMYFWTRLPTPGQTLASGSGGVSFAKHVDGTWINCISNDCSWRCSDNGDFRATMIDCATGTYSIGGDSDGSTMTGCLLQRCESIGTYFGADQGQGSFGGCFNFGIPIADDAVFIECSAGKGAFGVGQLNEGNFYRCQGGQGSFGGTNQPGGAHPGEFAGYAEDCRGGAGSFGGSVVSGGYGKLSGRLVRCIVDESFRSDVTPGAQTWRLEGAVIENSRLELATNNIHCVTLLDSNSRIYRSELIVAQGGTGVPVYASSALNVRVAGCYMNNATNDADGLHSNVTNLIGTPLNVIDDDIQ